MVKTYSLFFLIGFFLCFPYAYVPLGASNIRIEDIIVLFLLSIITFQRKTTANKNIFLMSLLLVIFIVYGTVLRLFFDFNYDNYPLIRIIGIMIYFVVFAFYMKENELRYMLRGAVYGGILSLFVILFFLFEHLISLNFSIRSMYVFKESMRGVTSFNPNTYGSLMLFSSFASYWLYSLTGARKYKYFACMLLLVPFILIIRRDIVGIILALVAIFFVSRRKKTKMIIYPIMLIICIKATFMIIDYLETMDSYKFMSHRDKQYIAAYDAVKSNKFGYGFGAETLIMKDKIDRQTVSHNSFLSLAIEIGVYNTALLVIVLGAVYFKLENIWLKFYLLAYFFQSQFGNGFYFYKYHFVFLAVVIFIITQSRRARHEAEANLNFLR